MFEGGEIEAIRKSVGNRKCWIGIKKLIVLSEMARQTEGQLRVSHGEMVRQASCRHGQSAQADCWLFKLKNYLSKHDIMNW